MSSHRALTLVEVLASLVLLTVLAATCVPMIQRAMRALQDSAPEFELLDLSRIADAFVAQPSDFGLESMPGEEALELSWPEHPDRPRPWITVRRVTADDATDAWIAFSCEGWTVHRWVPGDRDSEPLP